MVFQADDDEEMHDIIPPIKSISIDPICSDIPLSPRTPPNNDDDDSGIDLYTNFYLPTDMALPPSPSYKHSPSYKQSHYKQSPFSTPPQYPPRTPFNTLESHPPPTSHPRLETAFLPLTPEVSHPFHPDTPLVNAAKAEDENADISGLATHGLSVEESLTQEDSDRILRRYMYAVTQHIADCTANHMLGNGFCCCRRQAGDDEGAFGSGCAHNDDCKDDQEKDEHGEVKVEEVD